MSVPASIDTQVRIESKGTANNGQRQLKVFVEELGIKQYSTPIYIDEQVAATVDAGGFLFLHLERGKLKAGKQGTYASDYYWNASSGDPNAAAAQYDDQPTHDAEGFPVAGTTAAPAPRQQPQAQQPAARPPMQDSREVSIQRQVAAKAATELTIALYRQTPDEEPSYATNLWDEFFAHILDRIEHGIPQPEEQQP